MAKQATKRWSATAISATHAPLVLLSGDTPLTGAAVGPDLSPVDYLLISIVSCFALSCRAALATRNFARTEFRVIASGEKAGDTPARLGKIDIAVIFAGHLTEAETNAVANDAKSICTVTNSMSFPPTVTVSAESLGATRTTQR